MKYFKFTFCLCVICTFMLCGCEKEEKSIYEKMEFNNPERGVFIFSVNELGDICTLAGDGYVKMYTKSGDIKYAYPNCIDFAAFCIENNELYAYDAVKNEIVCMDLETGDKKIITGDFFVEEVLRMEKINDELYILVVPTDYQSRPDNNEYVDYCECLYRISLAEACQEEMEIDNIIAIYGAQNGRLYYYVYRDETYILCEYDTVTKEERVCYDMMNTYGIKYLSSFVYEQDVFVYSELVTPCVRAISMKDNIEIFQSEDILLLSGNEMDCIKGNVIYSGYLTDGIENKMQSFYAFSHLP